MHTNTNTRRKGKETAHIREYFTESPRNEVVERFDNDTPKLLYVYVRPNKTQNKE